ncbi:MAG: ORF6N domain-containing protein [bacterium]
MADLYEVRTSILKRAVTRNVDRIPEDFMFLLDMNELATLRCQFGTSKLIHVAVLMDETRGDKSERPQVAAVVLRLRYSGGHVGG